MEKPRFRVLAAEHGWFFYVKPEFGEAMFLGYDGIKGFNCRIFLKENPHLK